MTEYAPPGRGGSAVTRMMTGYHVGAVLTALLALVLIADFGWESMFVRRRCRRAAHAAGDVGQAARVRGVPGAVSTGSNAGRLDRRRAPGAGCGGEGRLPAISLALWVASFMGLLLVYGLNTWLPKIMGVAGYSTGDALGLLLALNLGAVTGLLVAGQISDARGNKPTVLLWFGLAAVFLAR